MSLFEKLKNKRYDLQEAPIDDKGNITPEPGEVKKSKEIVKKFVNKQKRIEKKNIKTNTQKGDKLLQNINQRKSADLTRADAYNRAYGTSGSSTEGAGGANTGTTPKIRKTKITGNVIPKKDLPKTKGVNQADVSKQAKKFTKEIEKKRVKKLAPIDLKKPTERIDLRTIKKRTTGRKRPSNAPSLADVNKKIDAKNPVEIGKTGPKPVKGTVLKRAYNKLGYETFARVRKTKVSAPGGINPEAKKIMGKQVSTDELLGNQRKIEKKIVNNTKNTSKPNLFSRASSKLKNIHKGIVKDAGFRKTSNFADYGKNITRNTYKNTLGGNTMRAVNKILPGKYKALAAIAVGTGAYLATRGKKKDGGGGGGGSTGKTAIKPSVSRKSINLSKPNAPNA